MVRLLLARLDVETNKTAQNRPTALMLASYIGHLEVVRLLLAHPDVEVNKIAQNGAAALLLASQNGHVEVVRLFLRARTSRSTRARRMVPRR